MSRYIERLTPAAWHRFKIALREDARASGKEAMETALVDLAKTLPTLRESERLERVYTNFGKSEALEAMALIACIQDDLDRQEMELSVEAGPPTATFRFVFVQIENASHEQVNDVAGMIAHFLKR